MKKIFSFLLLFILFASLPAQEGPCDNPKKLVPLKKGTAYVPDCDSLVVVNLARYKQLVYELEYYKSLQRDYKELSEGLDEKSELLEKHISNLDLYIAKQDSMIQKYRGLFIEGDSLVTRSTKNTDRALQELKKARLKMFLYSAAAIVVGGTLGYTVGQIAD